MIDRCEQILKTGFTDSTRVEFDRLLHEIETTDVDQPAGRVTGHPGARRSFSPSSAPAPAIVDDPAPAEPVRPVRREASSLTGRKRLLDEQLELLERANLLPHEESIIFGGSAHSLASIRRQLATLPPGFIDEIQIRANEIEDRVYARQQQAEADAARQARLDALREEQTPEEKAEVDEMFREARLAAERDNDPQLRLERLLTEIRDSLRGAR
jgi:hypothetical protein